MKCECADEKEKKISKEREINKDIKQVTYDVTIWRFRLIVVIKKRTSIFDLYCCWATYIGHYCNGNAIMNYTSIYSIRIVAGLHISFIVDMEMQKWIPLPPTSGLRNVSYCCQQCIRTLRLSGVNWPVILSHFKKISTLLGSRISWKSIGVYY